MGEDSKIPAVFALAVLAAAFIFVWQVWPIAGPIKVSMFTFDRISIIGWMLSIGSAIFAVLISMASVAKNDSSLTKPKADYYGLLLLSTLGMCLLVTSSNLISVILALEIMTFPLYALTGYFKARPSSAEGALKYFVMGAFAAAFFLFGTAFLFGSSGTVDFATLTSRASEIISGEGRVFFLFGVGMIVISFAFTMSLTPFHAWTPDAYDAAPLPVSALMATGVKVAVFIAFVRFVCATLVVPETLWHHLIWALAFVSMFFGNLAAMRQDNLKRMLAYLSIAQSGYLLTIFPSIFVDSNGATRVLIFYLIAYAIAMLGAFACLAAFESTGETTDIGRLLGLKNRRPFLAAAFSVFLISLAGFPPMLGFFGRCNLFLVVAKNGDIALVVAALVASCLSFYCCLRPIVIMYFYGGEEKEAEKQHVASAIVTVIAVAAMITIFFGLMPKNLIALVQNSVF